MLVSIEQRRLNLVRYGASVYPACLLTIGLS